MANSMNKKARDWISAPCGKCGGMPRIETDSYGTHQVCTRCGAARVITVRMNTSLWGDAAQAPGGAVNDPTRPFGRVRRR